jgi:hypothetical protein
MKKSSILFTVAFAMLADSHIPLFAQAGNAESAAISDDFRGKIVYEGIYEGTKSTPRRPPRRLSLGDLIESATSGSSEPYRGIMRIEVEYEGNGFKGVWRQQGEAAGAGSGTMTGTRVGTTCQVTMNDGSRYTADCDRYRFNARTENTGRRGEKYRGVVTTQATSLVDYVERDRQLALQAEKDRIAAAEAAARYAALPNAGPALTRKFEQYVRQDSQGWAFNRYDFGSLTNVKIVSGKAGVGTYVMRGEYTYNGGAPGSVMVEMNGPNLSCIQFWDAVIGCRGLRTAAQGQAMRDAAASALAGLLDSGSSSGTNCVPGIIRSDGSPDGMVCN